MCFFSSVQLLSCVWLLAKPWTAARQASLCITNSQSLFKLNVHWVGDAIQPSHSLPSPSLSVFNLSSIKVFSKQLALCIRWPKYQSFNFSIRPSNEYLGEVNVLEALGEARWEVRKVIFRQQWSRSQLIGYLRYFCCTSSISCRVGLTFWFQIPNPCLVFLCQYS